MIQDTSDNKRHFDHTLLSNLLVRSIIALLIIRFDAEGDEML